MSFTIVLLAMAAAGPAPDTDIVRYRVRRGDTIFDLGERYFIRRDDYLLVKRLNRVAAPRRLPVGQVLRIPRRILRTEPVEGRIAAFRGDVAVVVGGARRPAAMGFRVREGMALSTGAKAFLTVELPDASRFSLPSNSRLGVARLRRTLLTGEVERRFRLENGRSEWQVTPSAANPFAVETPVATTAVRGTGFRVTHAAEQAATSVGVLEGKVAVDADGAADEMAVSAGTGAVLRAGGSVLAAALIAAPELNRPEAVQKEDALSFSAQPVAGASAYGFEIAADAGFIDRIAEVKAATPDARFETIPGGTWFVRTTAFDANGLEGRANVYGFERQRNRIDLEAPQTAQNNGRKDYLFRWLGAGDGRVEYRFVLSRDEAGGDAIVDESGLQVSNITVSDLPRGTWYWRVWSIRYGNGSHSETVTPPQKLQIGAMP